MKLRDYQEQAVTDIFTAWEDSRSTLIVMPTGTGKCLAPSTLVLMFDGSIREARDVNRGDCLMGPDSKSRTVLSTVKGRDEMYRVTPTKGEPYEVNKPHILSLKMTPGSTRSCSKRFPSGSILNMSIEDYLSQNKTFKHCAKGWRTGVEFSARHVTVDPYYLGVWLGDGSSASVGITTIDAEVISFLDWYASTLGLHVSSYKGKDKTPIYFITHGIQKRANPLLDALRRYGVINNKHVPLIYKANSRDVRLRLLAGLIDSDGSATCGGYDLIFKLKRLADDTAYLARSLGYAAYVKPCKKTCVNNGVEGDYFRVSLSGHVAEIPVRIQRKKVNPRLQIKDALVTGIKITALGEGDYCGWELDGDGLFLLGDFTVTHNTQVFTSVINRIWPKRALVIAHREELIWQAVKRIESLGLGASVEMADLRASDSFFTDASVVVSTVQTQTAGNNGNGRMGHFKPGDFALLVIDEAHHATSPSYRKVIDYYQRNPDLKVLGVTATPDRADEAALGQVFESVAFDFEILDAINAGWLTPIHQQMVMIEGLDFSHIKTTAGDLNGGELAAVMEAEKNMQGIAAASLDIIEDKRTLIFTASVKQAEKLAEIFNRHKSGMADSVCGATPKEDRRRSLKSFHEGDTQVMVNCNVLTEGYDSPDIQVVIQARPTKSRCLYSQQIGRGTRPLTGILAGLDTPADRIAAIAASSKPRLLVVDFAGNSGRHKLITTADILGGKLDDEVIELAQRRAKTKGVVNMADELNRAQTELHLKIEEQKRREAARKAHLVAKAEFKTRSVDPFDILDIKPLRARGWDEGKSLTQKQRGVLLNQGVNINGMPYGQQKQLLMAIFQRMTNKMASINQCKVLRKRGMNTDGMTFAQASQAINDIAAREGWKKRA